MNFSPHIGHNLGQHINIPPPFNRHLQDHNYELWMRVVDGPLIPMMKDGERKVTPKTKAQYGEANYRILKLSTSLFVDLDLTSSITSLVLLQQKIFWTR